MGSYGKNEPIILLFSFFLSSSKKQAADRQDFVTISIDRALNTPGNL